MHHQGKALQLAMEQWCPIHESEETMQRTQHLLLLVEPEPR